MCLFSLVGIRGACESPSSSNLLFIDDDPGIDIQNAADTAQQKGVTLLQDCIDNAARHLQTHIENELQGIFTFEEVLENWTIGKFWNTYNSLETRSGLSLENQCQSCNYTSFHINEIVYQPKSDFDGKVVLKIGDTETEYTTTANAGERTYVEIGKTVNSNKFTITLESDDEFQLLDTHNVCTSDNVYLRTIGSAAIKVIGQTVCDVEKLICRYDRLFKLTMVWYSRVYFYDYLLSTRRVNYFTIYKSREEIMDRKQEVFQAFSISLKNSVNKLKKSITGNCCVTCKSSGWKYAAP